MIFDTDDTDKETRQLIEREVQAGRFRDAAAFVGAAVRHFLDSREGLGHSRDQIDSAISQAIASLERGEGVDGEQFFDELEEEEQHLRLRRG